MKWWKNEKNLWKVTKVVWSDGLILCQRSSVCHYLVPVASYLQNILNPLTWCKKVSSNLWKSFVTQNFVGFFYSLGYNRLCESSEIFRRYIKSAQWLRRHCQSGNLHDHHNQWISLWKSKTQYSPFIGWHSNMAMVALWTCVFTVVTVHAKFEFKKIPW